MNTATPDFHLDNPVFKTVSQAARKLGVKAYVVGGYVRDCLLEKPNDDIDIVVEGSGPDLAQEVADMLKCRVSIFKRFGTAMVHPKGGAEIEFVGARKESYTPDSRKPVVECGSIYEDQLRRDFTINAMSFSLQEEDFGTLIDPFDGVSDLEKGLIRTPCNPDITYSDDPLRMIRAIRFATRLGFEIVPESFEAIKRNRGRLSILSPERVHEEINKILMTDNPSRGFLLLDKSTLLELIIPALTNLKGVETLDGRGHKDNFAHTLQVLDNVSRHSDNLWLRWAALLHDVGKASTKRYDKNLGWTFHGHEVVGASMVYEIFKYLSLPLNEKMKYVQKLVFLHLRPIALVQDVVTDSAVRRLLFDAGDLIEDLMTLCEADITSKNEKTVARNLANFKLVRKKMLEVEERDRIRNFQPPIDGALIMKTYGIPPCSEIGQIKEVIKNAILDGEIPNDYDAAYALMRKVAAEMGLKEVSEA
mgnify:FL=1